MNIDGSIAAKIPSTNCIVMHSRSIATMDRLEVAREPLKQKKVPQKFQIFITLKYCVAPKM